MATQRTMAVQIDEAMKSAYRVVEGRASEERVENIKLLGGPVYTNDPVRNSAVQAEMIAALAEIVEEQAESSNDPKKLPKKGFVVPDPAERHWDDYELHARKWSAEDQALTLARKLQDEYALDPAMLHRMEDAMNEGGEGWTAHFLALYERAEEIKNEP